MKTYNCDEMLSYWWKFIHIQIITLMILWRLVQNCYRNSAFWWKIITLMKIYYRDENSITSNSSLSWYSILSLIWLSLLNQFVPIWSFWYFPGWVDGWVGQIKIKDHLSLAEVEDGAEFGKIQTIIINLIESNVKVKN